MLREAPTSMRRGLAHVLLVLAASLASACATPVGVSRVDARQVHRELSANAISTGQASAATRELLTRLGLRERFREDPEAVIAELHRGLAPSGDEDRVFALAELCFLHGERRRLRPYLAAAAVYAYAFLFPGESAPHPEAFEPRVAIARNLYNRGLTLGLDVEDDRFVKLAGGSYALPFATLHVAFDPAELEWAGHRLVRFTPASELAVRGLANRYRRAGVGAPLAASLGAVEPGGPLVGPDRIPNRIQVPVTALLRIADARARLASGELHGTLELYSDEEGAETTIDGRSVPLELEKSSALALTLEGAPIWDFGFAGFRLGDYLTLGQAEQLVFLRPHRAGRIPLVLVHGTFSSPATWAQLVNELENDPLVSSRYEIWLFIYNTGNPIPYSAGILAQTLRDVVAGLDPDASDPALRRMVVVGHSQGGLLTKLTAVTSGDHFWRNASDQPFDAVEMRDETRALLRRSLFYERLPFVERVIFMSTPHHGSYLSSYSVSNLISRMVKLPVRITQLGADVARGGDARLRRALARPATSLDNMRPGSVFLRALAEVPIDPAVTAHSIIPVRGDGPLSGQSDGVVRYESAHIEGVASELVVHHSGHSVQETPQGIQEVRRILLEHAGEAR
jgi:pimeloyl-ACP methyl ester carboxylesterase